MIKLRALRYLVMREIDRFGADDEGIGIVACLDSEIEEERADAMMVQAARENEIPPVFGGVTKEDDHVNIEVPCKRCGTEIVISYQPGVTPLSLCPMCRLPTKQQMEALEKLEKE